MQLAIEKKRERESMWSGLVRALIESRCIGRYQQPAAGPLRLLRAANGGSGGAQTHQPASHPTLASYPASQLASRIGLRRAPSLQNNCTLRDTSDKERARTRQAALSLSLPLSLRDVASKKRRRQASSSIVCQVFLSFAAQQLPLSPIGVGCKESEPQREMSKSQ